MKKTVQSILLVAIATSSINLKAQNILKDVINTGTQILNGNSNLGNGLSNDQIIGGLREALSIGTNNSTSSAGKINGFLSNPLIKIPFPKEAQVMESQLRALGLNKQCDNFVRQLNRAAENAASKAAPIFLSAITSMTINDGLGILKGGDNAATKYLQGATTAQLKAQFAPIVKNALNQVHITKYWKPLTTKYNKIPLVNKVNPDLELYVTDKALEGLFKLVSAEENKIRKDPMARVSDLLKKVFGS